MSFATYKENRVLREVALALGQDVSGITSNGALLKAILRGLGGTPDPFDTPVMLWRKLLAIYGGAPTPFDSEYRTIYKITEVLDVDRSVAYTRDRLIHNLWLSGKLLGGGGITPPSGGIFDGFGDMLVISTLQYPPNPGFEVCFGEGDVPLTSTAIAAGTYEGVTVETLADQGGFGEDFTNLTVDEQPVIGPVDEGSTINFDGVNDNLVSPDPTDVYAIDGKIFSLNVVARFPDSTKGGRIAGKSNGNGGWTMDLVPGSGYIQINVLQAGSSAVHKVNRITRALIDGQKHLVQVVLDATDNTNVAVDAYVDGIQEELVTITEATGTYGDSTGAGLMIGDTTNGAAFELASMIMTPPQATYPPVVELGDAIALWDIFPAGEAIPPVKLLDAYPDDLIAAWSLVDIGDRRYVQDLSFLDDVVFDGLTEADTGIFTQTEGRYKISFNLRMDVGGINQMILSDMITAAERSIHFYVTASNFFNLLVTNTTGTYYLPVGTQAFTLGVDYRVEIENNQGSNTLTVTIYNPNGTVLDTLTRSYSTGTFPGARDNLKFGSTADSLSPFTGRVWNVEYFQQIGQYRTSGPKTANFGQREFLDGTLEAWIAGGYVEMSGFDDRSGNGKYMIYTSSVGSWPRLYDTSKMNPFQLPIYTDDSLTTGSGATSDVFNISNNERTIYFTHQPTKNGSTTGGYMINKRSVANGGGWVIFVNPPKDNSSGCRLRFLCYDAAKTNILDLQYLDTTGDYDKAHVYALKVNGTDPTALVVTMYRDGIELTATEQVAQAGRTLLEYAGTTLRVGRDDASNNDYYGAAGTIIIYGAQHDEATIVDISNRLRLLHGTPVGEPVVYTDLVRTNLDHLIGAWSPVDIGGFCDGVVKDDRGYWRTAELTDGTKAAQDATQTSGGTVITEWADRLGRQASPMLNAGQNRPSGFYRQENTIVNRPAYYPYYTFDTKGQDWGWLYAANTGNKFDTLTGAEAYSAYMLLQIRKYRTDGSGEVGTVIGTRNAAGGYQLIHNQNTDRLYIQFFQAAGATHYQVDFTGYSNDDNFHIYCLEIDSTDGDIEVDLYEDDSVTPLAKTVTVARTGTYAAGDLNLAYGARITDNTRLTGRIGTLLYFDVAHDAVKRQEVFDAILDAHGVVPIVPDQELILDVPAWESGIQGAYSLRNLKTGVTDVVETDVGSFTAADIANDTPLAGTLLQFDGATGLVDLGFKTNVGINQLVVTIKFKVNDTALTGTQALISDLGATEMSLNATLDYTNKRITVSVQDGTTGFKGITGASNSVILGKYYTLVITNDYTTKTLSYVLSGGSSSSGSVNTVTADFTEAERANISIGGRTFSSSLYFTGEIFEVRYSEDGTLVHKWRNGYGWVDEIGTQDGTESGTRAVPSSVNAIVWKDQSGNGRGLGASDEFKPYFINSGAFPTIFGKPVIQNGTMSNETYANLSLGLTTRTVLCVVKFDYNTGQIGHIGFGNTGIALGMASSGLRLIGLTDYDYTGGETEQIHCLGFVFRPASPFTDLWLDGVMVRKGVNPGAPNSTTRMSLGWTSGINGQAQGLYGDILVWDEDKSAVMPQMSLNLMKAWGIAPPILTIP